jgi:hypothetical protein
MTDHNENVLFAATYASDQLCIDFFFTRDVLNLQFSTLPSVSVSCYHMVSIIIKFDCLSTVIIASISSYFTFATYRYF